MVLSAKECINRITPAKIKKDQCKVDEPYKKEQCRVIFAREKAR
jgi:hypothetical protein